MSRPRPAAALILLVSGVLAVGLSGAPAIGAPRNDGKPTARSIAAKLLPGTPALRQSLGIGPGEEDEGDEAESIRLRGEYQQSITAAPAVTAPTAGLLAARRSALRLPTVPGAWREITGKPFRNDPINRGANFGVGWGLVTGRMTAFAVSSGSVYAASASGGIWRSGNQGTTWRPVDRGLPRLAVGALATDPRDGSVWAGTGEANNASENQYGVGVYRLARGSSTWRRVGGPELRGAGVFRIAWIGNHVYVASSHGLYRRAVGTPRSTPWTAVLQPAGPQNYPPSSSVTDVIAVPGTHGRLVFAVVGWAGYSVPPATENNGFYVGLGGRGTFVRIRPLGDINPSTIGRTTLSSSLGWLYAVVQDTRSGDLRGQGVYASRFGPVGPWTRIADVDELAGSDSAQGTAASGFYPGIQATYNQYVLADPADAQHVYVGLEEVYETTNGGRTWKTIGPYWNFEISCEEVRRNPYDCPPTTHPDQHAAMIYQGQFWAGNDGGVWRRPLTWHDRGQWTNLNATIHTTQNYSIDVGPVGSGLAYWGGLQDNGESYTRTDMREVEQAFTGDGGDTIVDPRNGGRAVEEYVFLDMFLTTDAAATLREISPSCLTATDPPEVCDPNPRFIAPIEKDVANPDHWVAGGQFVWDDTKSWATVCSKTEGCDWQKVYDTGTGHSTTALAANGAVTYAAWCGSCNPPGFTRGLATNFGGAWHEVPLTGIPNRYITSIAVDPGNAAHVFLSIGSYSRRWIPDAGIGHVFESRDGGTSWRDVSGDLPDAPVYKVLIRSGRLVVGTEVGSFVTRGSSLGTPRVRWARLGTGLPAVTVWDLALAPDGRVVAGTHGRGDWEVMPSR
jgi:hypothetical protein